MSCVSCLVELKILGVVHKTVKAAAAAAAAAAAKAAAAAVVVRVADVIACNRVSTYPSGQ